MLKHLAAAMAAMTRPSLTAAALVALAPSAQAQFSVEWHQINGPFRVQATPGGAPNAPLCVHGLSCSCPGQGNYCGAHPNGTKVLFWKDGCARPAMQIQCVIQTAGAPPPQAVPVQRTLPRPGAQPAPAPATNAASPPQGAPDVFDKVVSKREVKPRPGGADEVEVYCTYFADFMVRELREGPAAGESVIVRNPGAPCVRAKIPGALVIEKTEELSMSLDGRKGPFLLFSSWQSPDETYFGVINAANGKFIFQDALMGKFQAVAFENGALRLRYRRGIGADCSLMQDMRGCWAKLIAAGKIPVALARQVPSAQICSASYNKPGSTPDNPSVVSYQTEMLIDANGAAQVLSVSGPIGCEGKT